MQDILDRYLPKQEATKSFQVSGIPASFDGQLTRFDRCKDALDVSRADMFQTVMAAGLDVVEPAVLEMLDAKDSDAA